MAQIVLFNGYPDKIGKRYVFCGKYVGPKSYVTGGDPVTVNQFLNYIDSIENNGVLSVSGTYIFRAVPAAAALRSGWSLKWYLAASPQTEISATTDLSGETFVVSGLGGVY